MSHELKEKLLNCLIQNNLLTWGEQSKNFNFFFYSLDNSDRKYDSPRDLGFEEIHKELTFEITIYNNFKKHPMPIITFYERSLRKHRNLPLYKELKISYEDAVNLFKNKKNVNDIWDLLNKNILEERLQKNLNISENKIKKNKI